MDRKFAPEFAPEPMSPYPEPPPPYDITPQPPSAPPSMIMPIETTVHVVVDNGKYGPYPRTMKCVHCGESIVTRTETKAGALTYILSTVLCLIGCFCGCCLIPCCITSCQDIIHKCPKCKNFLGAYERVKMRRR